jgi:SprT protein
MPEENSTLQSMKQFKDSISGNAYDFFVGLLVDKNVIIRHVAARKTKLGDFRHFRAKRIPEITVNQNLLPDTLTFILAHEVAHFLVHIHNKRRTEPHGKEWKEMFAYLLKQLIQNNAFSPEISNHIEKFLQNVKGTVGRGSKLFALLFPQEEEIEGTHILENLHNGALFVIPSSGKVYEKGEKRRTRYVCRQINNKRFYLVSRSLRVKLFE